MKGNLDVDIINTNRLIYKQNIFFEVGLTGLSLGPFYLVPII